MSCGEPDAGGLARPVRRAGEQTAARKRGTAARVRPNFSIVQRKLLQLNDFASTAAVARTVNAFEHHYNEIAEAFDWNFTSAHLDRLLARLADYQPALQRAA